MIAKEKSIIQDINSQTVPGSFTGTYINSGYKTVRKGVKKLNQSSFSKLLTAVSSEIKNTAFNPSVYNKVKKSANGLPFVSSVMEEVGIYGIIFAGGLNLCQYYKKNSPPPMPPVPF